MNIRFLKPVLLATAAALALSACATATPYGPAGPQSRYGYSEQRVDADRYRVSFAGNSVTSREQVEMSLLLRAAELTLESGHDWFATVNRATDRDVRLTGTPDPFYYDRYSPFWVRRGATTAAACGARGVTAIRSVRTSTSARSTGSRPPPRSSSVAAPSRPAIRTPSTPAR